MDAVETIRASDDLERVLSAGERALWTSGDRLAARVAFDRAYRLAEAAGDAAAMGRAVLGACGLGLDEHRGTAVAVLLEGRIQQLLAGGGLPASVRLRLRIRRAAEAAHRTGAPRGLLALLREARHAGDPVATAEAAAAATHCLPWPEQRRLRGVLTREVVAASFRTGRRADRLTGLLRQVADGFLDGDPHAPRHLARVKDMLARDGNEAAGALVGAMDVLLTVRAGRLADAELQARAAAAAGAAAGDPDAAGRLGTQLLAVRWFQGRVADHLPDARALTCSPALNDVDDGPLAALALAAAAAGDTPEAGAALARLRHRGPARLSRLVTLHGVVEAADLLGDQETAEAAYQELRPHARLPMVAEPGIACFGSAEHALGVAALTAGRPEAAVTHLQAAIADNLVLAHRPAVTLSRARLAQALFRRAGAGDAAEGERQLGQARQDADTLGT